MLSNSARLLRKGAAMTTTPVPGAGVPGLDAIRRNWGWFVFLGVALIILGMVALGYPLLVTGATVVVIGWLLIFAGVVHGVHAFGTQTWGSMLWHLLVGVLDIIVGIWLLVNPTGGALTLTLLIAILLVVSGIVQIVASITYRLPSWVWGVLSGVISVVLGGMVWRQWPISAIWFIGMAVGIMLIFRGWMWLMLGIMVKNAAPKM
jgi:uncharacterized membrane protein HdeD (DUF308 family)